MNSAITVVIREWEREEVEICVRASVMTQKLSQVRSCKVLRRAVAHELGVIVGIHTCYHKQDAAFQNPNDQQHKIGMYFGANLPATIPARERVPCPPFFSFQPFYLHILFANLTKISTIWRPDSRGKFAGFKLLQIVKNL